MWLVNILWFFVWLQTHSVAAFKGVCTWQNLTFSPRSPSSTQFTTFTTLISTSTLLSTVSARLNETIIATSTMSSITTVVDFTTVSANSLFDIELVSVVGFYFDDQSLQRSYLSAYYYVHTEIHQWERVAANASDTGLQIVAAIPSSSALTSTSAFSVQTSSPPASTSSTADKAVSSASETSIASKTSSAGTLSATDSAVSRTSTSASTTSSGITTPMTTSTSTSSSVPVASSSSITSILTASGSPTIDVSSSVIPSSILILPTTTSSPSSTTSSSPSITTATASSESNTSNPSATSLKSTSHKLSSKEVIGISFGAVAAAAILSLLLFALYRRHRAQQVADDAAVNNKHSSFPESAWLYDPRMTPAAASRCSGSPVSSMHSSISSSASRRDEALLSAIAIPASLPKRHVSNPVGGALTSNPPSSAQRHRPFSSVPEFKTLPPTPSAAATSASSLPSPIAEISSPKETKRESLPAILKIGGGKKRPLTAAPVIQKVEMGPNKPLPPRPVINAKDRPFSFEAGDDDAQQFGIAK
ncbi:hypothetical protein KCU95_g240, partial [Aureobasidium melanogenum]